MTEILSTVLHWIRAFIAITWLSRVGAFLSPADTETRVHAFTTCTLDYCHAPLSGLQESNSYFKTQQHGLKPEREHILHRFLKSLLWLPVSFRIDLKILLLVYKTFSGFCPPYLSEMLAFYEPSRTPGSSGGRFLIIPRVRTKIYGEASFYCYSPRLWRDLLEDLRAAERF